MVDLRASDADREHAAEALRRHGAEGRLTTDELEDRLSQALAATTVGQLAALQEDLPAAPRPAVEPREVKVGWPGLRSFRQQHILESAPTGAWRSVVQHIVPNLVSGTHTMVDERPGEMLVFRSVTRPWWVWLACVAFFPIGLLALMVRTETRIVLTLTRLEDGRTQLDVRGQATRPVRRAFAEISAPP